MRTYLSSPIGIDTEFNLFHPVFDAGSELPCKSSNLLIGSASKENEYLTVKIYQGNNYNSSLNVFLDEINIKKIINCNRGQPQVSVSFEISTVSIMTTVVSNLSHEIIKKSSIPINSSSNYLSISHQLFNIEHVDIAKKLSYAKRLVRTNTNIINSIKNENHLASHIIEKIVLAIHKIEYILINQTDIKKLDYLLDELSELSWKLNITSLANHSTFE